MSFITVVLYHAVNRKCDCVPYIHIVDSAEDSYTEREGGREGGREAGIYLSTQSPSIYRISSIRRHPHLVAALEQ